jgi:alpha-mannosidase
VRRLIEEGYFAREGTPGGGGKGRTLRTEQRVERLRIRLEEMVFWRERAQVDLDEWTFNGQPLALGRPWPKLEGVSILEHPPVALPKTWPLEEARLELDLGGEGLVRVSYPGAGEDAFGLDPQHTSWPPKGHELSLSVEAVARLPFGVPNRGARLERARLVWTEVELVGLARKLSLVMEAARALQDHDAVDPLLACGERALAALAWPSATPEYLSRTAGSFEMQQIWALPEGLQAYPPSLDEEQRNSIRSAAVALDGELAELKRRYPAEGSVALTGHAHLDLAWLWPLDETRRKARRTYHTAAGLIDRYPEFIFNQSTAQAYAWIAEDDPALFERMKEMSAAGSWEPNGAMWVEPDVNLPAGESLVRQLLYGQRFFQKHFGSTHAVCWLPDCFGFTGALPQLLSSAGVSNFFTHKMNWSETDKFPLDLFWWEGLDGSRVLAHQFWNPLGGYNGEPGPASTVATWSNYRGKRYFPETLLAVGYGDGGGGPTAEMIERVRAADNLPAVPDLRFTKVADFFDSARSAVAETDLPVWVGEMYLEYHRGTYTTQGRTKYLHRRAERDLVAAEVVGAMVALARGERPASLEPAWQVLLRNQFHDILPGSSIREVYATAESELQGVVDEAAAAIEREMDRLGEAVVDSGSIDGLLVVNPDVAPRPVRLESPGTLPGGQEVEGGSVLSGTQTVRGLSAQVLLEAAPQSALEVSENQLENSFVRVSLGSDGTLESVYDKLGQREVLDGPGNQLWAYVDKPRAFDAWEVDAGYRSEGVEVGDVSRMSVSESGPHRAAVRIARRFRSSSVVQDVRLWANSARVELKTTLDWHDRHWLLKAIFPVAVRSPRATFETAFGVVERPTHGNTSWDAAMFEVPGHRFVDLSEPGYGVALLNDGKYGHHVFGSEMGISLLRSPTYPDPLADEGVQTFTYALYPHRGTWFEGGVLAEAEDLNRPLLARSVQAEAERTWSAVELRGARLGLGALKVCEDSEDLLLRLYEPQGATERAAVELPDGWQLDAEVDLLEEPVGAPDTHFAPFRVRSYLIRKTG